MGLSPQGDPTLREGGGEGVTGRHPLLAGLAASRLHEELAGTVLLVDPKSRLSALESVIIGDEYATI